MSKVRHCFLLCFYRVKSIPYGDLQSEEYSVWGILSSQTRKNFQNVVAFLGLCNLFHKLGIVLRLN